MDMPVTLWKQNGHLQVENSLTKLKVPLVASDDEEEPLQFNVGEIKAKAVLPVSSINYLVNVVAAYNKYMTHDAKSIPRDTVSIEVAINDDSDAVEFYSAANSGAFLCKIQTIDGESGGNFIIPNYMPDGSPLEFFIPPIGRLPRLVKTCSGQKVKVVPKGYIPPPDQERMA